MAIVFGGRTDIYHWLDTDAVAKDHIPTGKSGFPNIKFLHHLVQPSPFFSGGSSVRK